MPVLQYKNTSHQGAHAVQHSSTIAAACNQSLFPSSLTGLNFHQTSGLGSLVWAVWAVWTHLSCSGKLGCVETGLCQLALPLVAVTFGIFWNALFNSLHLCSSWSPVSMDPSAPRVVAFRVGISGLNSSLRSRCLLARHMRHFFPKWHLISLNITHMRKHKVFLCALSCPPKPEPRTVENKEKTHKTRPALTRKSVIMCDYHWLSMIIQWIINHQMHSALEESWVRRPRWGAWTSHSALNHRDLSKSSKQDQTCQSMLVISVWGSNQSNAAAGRYCQWLTNKPNSVPARFWKLCR